MNAKLQQVIITDLDLVGDGKDNPYRRLIQCWSLEGKLLFQKDPWLEQTKVENLVYGQKYGFEK